MDAPSSSINMEALTHHGDHPRFFQEAASSKDASMPVMTTWLSEDAPWTALQDNTSIEDTDMQNARAMTQFTGSQTAPGAFTTYRTTGMRSECDTIPDDSGYRSFVPSSIESTSLYGDPHYALSQDLDSEVGNFEINFGDSPSMNGTYGTQKTAEAQSKVVQNSDASLWCEVCRVGVRTNSELKKHEHRHRKPWSCSDKECERSHPGQGFASQNDLIRHQMTVHKEYRRGKTYVCRHGNCARKDPKPWPRADNFRSHLKRVHSIDMTADADLSNYLYSAGYAHPEDLSGVGINHQDALNFSGGQDLMPGSFTANASIEEFPEIPTPAASATPYMSAARASIAPDSLLMPPPPTNKSSSPMVTTSSVRRSRGVQYPSARRASVPSSGSGSTIEAPRSDRTTKEESLTPVPVSRSSFDSGDRSDAESEPVSSINEASDAKEVLHKIALHSAASRDGSAAASSIDVSHDRSKWVEYLRSIPKDLLQEALEGSVADVKSEDKSTPSSSGDQVCDQCSKTFTRMCELRKHLKRHERPYGCTVLGCDKLFGSKNDWKRHENGQHSLEDLWRCDNTDKGCELFFGKKTAFEDHLRQCNPMLKDVDIKNKVSFNRLGSHNRDAYWCGFCKDILNVVPDGGSDTEQRFNHIDDHFMGRHGFPKQKIEEWLYPQTKVTPTEEASEPGRKRKTSPDSEDRPLKQMHKQRR